MTNARLTTKLIEDVVAEVAGEDVVPLVKLLKNKKNISEFKLADSAKQEINSVRNMLYRLYNVNLVSFIRKKDKKKGWYIYYWTFESKKVKYLLRKLKERQLQKLKTRLEREKQSQFYICPNKCARLDFDQSMNFEFKCPECGEIIQQEDNTQKIKKIEEDIKALEKELKKKA
jgi:transcription initiation factor TFIIE subunit alpha